MNVILLVTISLVLAFLNTSIIHIIKTKFPRSYFSLGQLVVTDKEDITFSGLFTKFFPPLLISFFIGLFSKKNGLELTILFGFFASFLVIWPVILSGDELLSWEAKKKIKSLYLIYVFYILVHILFAYLGFIIGKSVRGVQFNNIISSLINAYTNWPSIVQSVVTNTVSGLIVAAIAGLVTRCYRSLIKRINRKIIEERIENENK